MRRKRLDCLGEEKVNRGENKALAVALMLYFDAGLAPCSKNKYNILLWKN